MDMCSGWTQIMPSLVTGLLALVGVAAGIGGTAWVHARERTKKLNDERVAMRSALLAELTFLCKSYAYREAAIGSAGLLDRPSFDVPLREATEVYDRLLDRIGLLTEDQGGKVVHAYLAAKHLLPNLRRLEAARDEEGQAHPGVPSEDYIRIRNSNFSEARALHCERVVLFDEAIKALEAK